MCSPAPILRRMASVSYTHLMTRADYDKYDLLIGMDSANIRNMTRLCGGDTAGKIHRLLDCTDRPGDVADPWYTGDFAVTWRRCV